MEDKVTIELSRSAAQFFLDNAPPVEYLDARQKEFIRELKKALGPNV